MLYKTLTAVILIKIVYKFLFVFLNYRRSAIRYAGPLIKGVPQSATRVHWLKEPREKWSRVH